MAGCCYIFDVCFSVSSHVVYSKNVKKLMALESLSYSNEVLTDNKKNYIWINLDQKRFFRGKMISIRNKNYSQKLSHFKHSKVFSEVKN